MIATGEACSASVVLKKRPDSRSRFSIESALAVYPVISTPPSFRRPALTGAVWLACAPTAAHDLQLVSTSWHSSIVSGFLRFASRNSERLLRIPYFVNTKTSGFRLMRLVVTNSFKPLMTETTATTVMTPMMTPSSVNPERSLWLPRAWSDVRRSSRASMALGRPSAGFHRLLLLLAHRLDLVPFLDGPQRLERAADHGLAVFQPVF